MLLKKIFIVLAPVTAALALLSCNTLLSSSQTDFAPVTQEMSQAGIKTIYSELGQAGGKVFTLDPKTSMVRIYAFRTGRAAKLGHNHVLSAPQFTGFFYLPPSGTSNSRFDLEFRLDQLEIDNPEYRSLLGSAFSSVLSHEAIEGTREHMLGEDNMQAEKFPFVRIHSLQVSGEFPKFAAKVQVDMHGQKREMWVPLSVEGLPDRLSVAGSFVLRQTDFGAQPYSVLGGMLAVQDEIVIEFKLLGAQEPLSLSIEKASGAKRAKMEKSPDPSALRNQ
jgi:polyisoprenoid-binding protein YceI